MSLWMDVLLQMLFFMLCLVTLLLLLCGLSVIIHWIIDSIKDMLPEKEYPNENV